MHALPALRRWRPGLLLSAVLTITVPTLLVVLSVSDTPLPSPRHEPAGPPASAQARAGLSLLGKSAAADVTKSYQGVELLAQRGVSGQDTIVSNVWHKAGLTVTQTSDAATVAGGQPYVSYDAGSGSAEGVFGVTKALVTLLGKHYSATYSGTGSAIGRPALIIELRRADGSLAARIWLDKQTLVPLRREVYDVSSSLISEDAFVQVQFGVRTRPPAPAAGSPARPAWAAVTPPAQLVADLNRQGWRLPTALPGDLPLYAAARAQAGPGEVVQLGYSDGLSVVSLFVQRGTLASRPAGWQQASLPGHQVYVEGNSIIWSAGGFVYTMLADAPPRIAAQVVASLPQNAAPGLLGRIGRGFGRLAALLNPFG